MNCPNCKSDLTSRPYSYQCNECGFRINKKIAGRQLTDDMLNDLITKGQTKIINGFVSKKGKLFNASLKVNGNKIDFIFPKRIKKDFKPQGIRVESFIPGNVDIKITGELSFDYTVNFGLLPAFTTECLGVISALKVLRFYKYNKEVNISVNNKELAERVLLTNKEEYLIALQKELENFTKWNIAYEKNSTPNLQGGIDYMTFPKGIFPWLEKVDTEVTGDYIYIVLDDCPAVKAQLLSAISSAKQEGDRFVLPIGAEKAFNSWLESVKY